MVSRPSTQRIANLAHYFYFLDLITNKLYFLAIKYQELGIRTINDDTSIRTGKYGDYIFYKTINMKKPKFISLKSFNKDYKKCADADIISFINGNV